jgi:hypothetical protein
MYNFFTGPKLTIFFLAVAMVIGVFFPVPVEKGLKQFFSFSYKQEKMTQIILGIVQIVVALFIPFVLFAFIGLLAGTSYHYYTRHAHIMSDSKPNKGRRGASGEEHD